MKILILGADGYIGWPTAMFFSFLGHKITAVDNFSKRKIELEMGVKPLNQITTLQERIHVWNSNINNNIEFFIGDLCNHKFIYNVLEKSRPDAIIHFAEQPSAPYSMTSREKAFFTQYNNVMGNLNLLFAINKYCKNTHLIKLGSMGEYGTPNIDIEEGWIEIEHNGRKEKTLYPKRPGSFYHLSKVFDSQNIEFCCRNWNLKCTDLNQGVVYGIETEQTKLDERLTTSFHYDHVFGTVINRFIVQSISNIDLTVYGKGSQIRSFLNIEDTLQCINIALENPSKNGEYRVFNQFTEIFSIEELAKNILITASKIGSKSKINYIANPRNEMNQHYYNPKHSSLIDLGLMPKKINHEFLELFLEKIKIYRDNINEKLIYPSIKW